MMERVMSEKKRRERILIKNSLVFKGNVVSNKPISVFLCIILCGSLFFLPRINGGH